MAVINRITHDIQQGLADLNPAQPWETTVLATNFIHPTLRRSG
jgi:hypothetical protein